MTSKPTTVRVGLTPSYPVHIGTGLLDRIGDLLRLPAGTEKAAVVTHPAIRRAWGPKLQRGLERAGLQVTWCVLPAGEASKSVAAAGKISGALARAGFHRGDAVFAFGGGVAGDVGAYVASTFNRGIPVVQVPTTLLAMVDSSIGGKTGVNLPEGKNLVGTFHQPRAVVADLGVLSTLPKREFRAGLAEVLKYGFISEPALLRTVIGLSDEILDGKPVLDDIVTRSARIKAKVVAADEKESGLRAILNYGHTLGHAIESLAAPKLHHGEAISIGMVYAAEVARITGLSDLVDAHRAAFRGVGLPVRTKGLRWSRVLDRMRVDKKYDKGLRFVLLEGPGRPVVRRVDETALEQAYGAVSG